MKLCQYLHLGSITLSQKSRQLTILAHGAASASGPIPKRVLQSRC